MTSAGRLLISHITLRGPELAQIYALVAAHTELSYAQIRAAVASRPADAADLVDATLREALSFLCGVGLVERSGSALARASFAATPNVTRWPFRLLLLNQLAHHPDPRQRALLAVHQVLVTEDVLSIQGAALRELIERSTLHDLFTWTSEKLTFWAHLASYLGLVRRLEIGAAAPLRNDRAGGTPARPAQQPATAGFVVVAEGFKLTALTCAPSDLTAATTQGCCSTPRTAQRGDSHRGLQRCARSFPNRD